MLWTLAQDLIMCFEQNAEFGYALWATAQDLVMRYGR
jgi:hypothetical protein